MIAVLCLLTIIGASVYSIARENIKFHEQLEKTITIDKVNFGNFGGRIEIP